MLKYRLIVGPILIAVTFGLLILDQYLGSIEIEPQRSLPPGLILLAVFLIFTGMLLLFLVLIPFGIWNLFTGTQLESLEDNPLIGIPYFGILAFLELFRFAPGAVQERAWKNDDPRVSRAE